VERIVAGTAKRFCFDKKLTIVAMGFPPELMVFILLRTTKTTHPQLSRDAL